MNDTLPLWLQQPEGKTLEFKRDLSSPRNVLKTLVAFANSAGGKLLIGVDEARHVVGVADPLDEEERICNLIADGIAPRLLPNVELLSVGDATLLIVEAFPSSARPHYLAAQGPVGLWASKARRCPSEASFCRIRRPIVELWGKKPVFSKSGEAKNGPLRRIFAEAVAQGLPEPSITEIATGVRLTVYPSTSHLMEVPAPDSDALAHTGEQVSEQVTSLLRYCAEQPRSKQELLAALHLGRAYLNYKRHIVPLLERGLLAPTIPDKPNSRLQRYRLTPQGRALLEKPQP